MAYLSEGVPDGTIFVGGFVVFGWFVKDLGGAVINELDLVYGPVTVNGLAPANEIIGVQCQEPSIPGM